MAVSYDSSRVLVTGAAGFIGTNLIRHLLEQKAEVTATDRVSADFRHVPAACKIVKGDLLNEADMKPLGQDYDYVFHLAARGDLDGKSLHDYRTNFLGTENLLKQVLSPRVKRVVTYSTLLATGIWDETRFITEDEPRHTTTLYGQSKILGEETTRRLCEDAGVTWTVIRPVSVYGPYGHVPYRDFFLTIKRGQYFHVGAARNLISMIHVDNLCDLTLLLANHPDAANEVFFGGELYPYTMHQFAETAAKFFGTRIRTVPLPVALAAAYGLGVFKQAGLKVPLYPYRLRTIRTNYCVDIRKSLGCGYMPRISLENGMTKTLNWYVQNDQAFR
jgi:GlcNAc-P-P-Und epimerase